jgi:hypothetical protein
LGAPVNFTCRSWTTGVSAPCHFQLASILRFQTPVCVISAEIPDKNPEICLPACCMHDTPAITPAMATHASVAAVCVPVHTCVIMHPARPSQHTPRTHRILRRSETDAADWHWHRVPVIVVLYTKIDRRVHRCSGSAWVASAPHRLNVNGYATMVHVPARL